MPSIDAIIIDDDEEDRYIARRYLARNPNIGTIVEVESGYQFIEDVADNTAQVSSPFIILVDINMPRLDGFGTLQELKRLMAEGTLPRGCVIMMYTSSNNPNDRERLKDFDFVSGYILKPLDDAQTETLVNLCIG